VKSEECDTKNLPLQFELQGEVFIMDFDKVL